MWGSVLELEFSALYDIQKPLSVVTLQLPSGLVNIQAAGKAFTFLLL